MPEPRIPTTANRTALAPSLSTFLRLFPKLRLGGEEDFHAERRRHLEVFGIHAIPKEKVHSIHEVEFTAIRGPYGTIPIRVLYPKSGEDRRKKGESAALIYFHGGGYTIGSVDEFENGLRLLAECSGAQVYAVDYRLAPEFKFPTQIDEYSTVIDALLGDFGRIRGVHPDRVCGGGDSAGGNMTASIVLGRRDHGQKNLAAQFLLYPEMRPPFDTPAAAENNSGYYLEANGVFGFASNYLPRGLAPGYKYISPGMQNLEYLQDQPPAAVFTSGFDPLRDVGVEYASKLDQAGVRVRWYHYENMTHGWLQMTAWSEEAVQAVRDVAEEVKRLAYGNYI
ncbi:lipase/esterase [Phyllosticta capitalensis]|uniref:Lipase/esterase n=1 Tax=Phyllosticta capitalensis TaxID=121624 RepID=A0ABR1YAB1_9PEZI